MEWQVSKIWSGVCWVIGGGSSIADEFNIHSVVAPEEMHEFKAFGKHLKPIHNDHIIGVNLAAFLGEWVDVAFWGDTDTYNMYKGYYDEFSGLKVSCSPKFLNKNITSIKYLNRNHEGGLKIPDTSVSWEHSSINIGGEEKFLNIGNSGAAAISLAYHLGCTEIRLLGFDMKNSKDNRIHFHAGYPKKNYILTNKMVKAGNTKVPREERKTAPYEKHILAFKKIAEDSKELGIKILNVNSNSAIQDFEKVSLSDLIDLPCKFKQKQVKQSIKENKIQEQIIDDPCPICEKSGFVSYENVNNIPVKYCKNCGTFKQNIGGVDLKSFYENKYHNGVYTHSLDQDKKVASLRFDSYKKEGIFNSDSAIYLDFGSGNGSFVDHCRNNNINCFGVEISKTSRDNPFVYNAENLIDVNFPTEYFDVVFIHDVLEHLEDPIKIIKEINRILKQNGKLILEYPDFFVEEGKHHWKEIEHIWMCPKDSLITALQQNGYKISKAHNPIPGKFLLYCDVVKSDTISILVPPGVGDIQWVLVKLQSFLEKNNIKTIPDVYICCFNTEKKRSKEYLKLFPFVNVKGYKTVPKQQIPWKEAYNFPGRTVFKNIAGCDYFIAYNGQLRDPKKLENIASEYTCNYDLPMFESKYQLKYGIDFKQEHGDYIVGYFIDHGVYKTHWSDVLSHGKLAQILDMICSNLNCKLVLIGSDWDLDCKINNFISNCFSGRVISMIGKTNIEEVFGIIKNAKGVIGFPSGITIMSTYFKIPTFMFWSDYFNDVFYEASCYPIEKCNTYAYTKCENVSVNSVVSEFERITTLNKNKVKYVVCVLKSGGDYTGEYVINLRKNVFNNLKYSVEFRCLTDVENLNIPKNEIIQLQDDLPGWWSKLELFKKGLFEKDSQILYFDLDTVIVGSVDYMFDDFKSGFYMLEGFASHSPYASGIMLFNSDMSFIYDYFVKIVNNKNIMYKKDKKALKGDQSFICETYKKIKGKLPFKIKRDGKILSYKKDGLNQEITSKKLENVSVVCFHGKPRPHEIKNENIKKYWDTEDLTC